MLRVTFGEAVIFAFANIFGVGITGVQNKIVIVGLFRFLFFSSFSKKGYILNSREIVGLSFASPKVSLLWANAPKVSPLVKANY